MASRLVSLSLSFINCVRKGRAGRFFRAVVFFTQRREGRADHALFIGDSIKETSGEKVNNLGLDSRQFAEYTGRLQTPAAAEKSSLFEAEKNPCRMKEVTSHQTHFRKLRDDYSRCLIHTECWASQQGVLSGWQGSVMLSRNCLLSDETWLSSDSLSPFMLTIILIMIQRSG